MKTGIQRKDAGTTQRRGQENFLALRVPCSALRVCVASLLLCAFALNSHSAGFRITQTITLTNSANLTNGIQFTLNGDVRTGEDIVTNAANQFARSNRIDYATTNLLAHIAAHPFAGVSLGTSTATNNIVLVGNTNLVINGSFFGAWGNVTNVTNVVYGASPVVLPFGPESNAFRNFIMSMVVDAINAWATNRFSNNAPALAHYANLTTAQTLSNKAFVNFSSPGVGVNSMQLGSGSLAVADYSFVAGLNASNSPNASASVVLGNDAFSSDYSSVVIGDNARSDSSQYYTIVIGAFLNATNKYFGIISPDPTGTFGSSTFGPFADFQMWLGSASISVWIPGALHVQKLSQLGLVTSTNLWATSMVAGIGSAGYVKMTNAAIAASGLTATNLDAISATIRSGNVTSTVVQATSLRGATLDTSGNGIVGNDLTVTNELAVLGSATLTSDVSLLSTLNVAALSSLKDVNTTGTNRFDYAVSFSKTNIVSLANGANDLDPGLRAYLKVSGPTAAYSIDKIDKGWDGRRLLIQKTDSYTMTIPNNSGSGVLGDSAKILTGTGGTLTVTNNPGFVELIYDSDTSRWGVIRTSN